MYNNYQRLLNIKCHKLSMLLIVFILLIIFSIYLGNLEVYERYNLMGIYKENYLYVNVPLENSDTIIKAEYLCINRKKYKFKISNISDLLYDYSLNVNYQEIIMNIEKVFLENELVNITFYYNKEKLYKKIINIIKE